MKCTLKHTIRVGIWLTALACLAGQARAQDCDVLLQTVQGLSASADRDDSTLRLIISNAEEARNCFTPADTTNTVLLLRYELWAYNLLGPEGGWEERWELFQRYEKAATDEHRGRARLAVMRLLSLQGRYREAAGVYVTLRPFQDSLSHARQVGSHLDGAYLESEAGRYGDALNAVAEAYALEPAPREAARAAYQEASILIAGLDSLPPRLSGSLSRAIAAMDTLPDLRYDLQARSLLAEFYLRRDQPDSALVLFAETAVLARGRDDMNGLVNTYRRHGRGLMKLERYRDAIPVLERAAFLADSASVGEYRFSLPVLLARAHHLKGDDTEALALLSGVLGLTLPDTDDLYYFLLRAQSEARKLQYRIQLSYVRPEWKWFSLLSLIIILAISGVAYRYRRLWKREQARFLEATEGKEEEVELVDRRRGYVFIILFEPEKATPIIKDPAIRDAVTQGCSDATQVFLAAAELEEHHEGTHLKSPAKTYRQTFRRAFAKRGWPVPATIEEWKQHFRDHPIS